VPGPGLQAVRPGYARALAPGVPKGRYDPSVQAMTALLRGELCQSVRQTRAVMTQVMGAKTQQKVSEALAPAVAQAMDYAQICGPVTVGLSNPYTVLAAQSCFRPMFSEALSHLCRVSFEPAEGQTKMTIRRALPTCEFLAPNASMRGFGFIDHCRFWWA